MDFENTVAFIFALQTSLEVSARKHKQPIARLDSFIASLAILLGRAGAKP
jgi:hypothetical protein